MGRGRHEPRQGSANRVPRPCWKPPPGRISARSNSRKRELLNPEIVAVGVAEKTHIVYCSPESDVWNLQRRHITKDVAPELPLGRGCTQSIFLPLRPWVDGG